MGGSPHTNTFEIQDENPAARAEGRGVGGAQAIFHTLNPK